MYGVERDADDRIAIRTRDESVSGPKRYSTNDVNRNRFG